MSWYTQLKKQHKNSSLSNFFDISLQLVIIHKEIFKIEQVFIAISMYKMSSKSIENEVWNFEI